eukprot:g1049.t1
METKLLDLQMGRADLRLVRVENLSKRHREEACRKEAQDLEMVRAFGMKVCRHYARVNKLTFEDLFSHLDADGDGAIDEEDAIFASFFATVDKDIQEEEFDLAENEAVEEETPELPDIEAEKVNILEEGAPDALDEIAPPEPDEDWSASALGQTLQQGRSIPKKVVKAELTPDEVKSLFASVLEPDAVKLSPEAFSRILKVYYKVVKDCLPQLIVPQILQQHHGFRRHL